MTKRCLHSFTSFRRDHKGEIECFDYLVRGRPDPYTGKRWVVATNQPNLAIAIATVAYRLGVSVEGLSAECICILSPEAANRFRWVG